jgi:hypothetical protein
MSKPGALSAETKMQLGTNALAGIARETAVTLAQKATEVLRNLTANDSSRAHLVEVGILKPLM